MTDISVVIPCHNAERWIGQAIGSVLRQTHPPKEVIVVDDGSTDESRKVVSGFGDDVVLLRTDHRNGASARADGAEHARGDALLFLDADDLLGPRALEGLASALPSDGLAYSHWRRYEEVAPGTWVPRPASCAPLAPWQDELSGWLTGWYCPPAALLWSREAYARSGGWRRGRVCNQDGDLAMRALASGVEVRKAAFGETFYRRLAEETVSDRRVSPEGLRARLDILDEVRQILDARGRLSDYKNALAEAYDAVQKDANEAGDEPSAVRAARSARARPGAVSLRQAAGRYALRKERSSVRDGSDACPGPASGSRQTFGPETLVSVVVPTFERPDQTERAVRSILAQTHERLEVLVVDDASADDTAERVEGLGDDRVEVLCQPENGGVARARNRGMAEARGPLIAFLDSDDEWLPSKTQRSLELFARGGPEVGIVTCGTRTMRSQGEPPEDRVAEGQGFIFEELLEVNPLHGAPSSAVMRREVFETIGGFDPSLPAIEDWDYWIRAARFFAFAALPEPLAIYHDPDDEKRRSRRFRANMDARGMLYRRYRDDLRRAGRAQAFLMRSARRELTATSGHAAKGRQLVLEALAEGPWRPNLYPWLPYMVMPDHIRALLRRVDARAAPRPV